jgi:hypothetical protein
MVLSEILSTSFLFSIAIIIILVGGLFAYFNHRFSEQNHKISSMLALVSTMAEEMQFFRSKLRNNTQEKCNDAIHIVPQFLGGNMNSEDSNLIEVSDDEGNDDSDSEVDEDEDSDSESDSEIDEDSDSDADSDSDENIKNISIDLGNEIDIDLDIDLSNRNTKTINLSEDITSFDIPSNTLENIDLQSIELTNSSNDDNDNDNDNDNTNKNKVEYKKMSLNKLREIIVEKGLVVDATKLKKNDILKILGDE